MSQSKQKKSDEYFDITEVVLDYLKYWKWFILSVIICLGITYFYLKSSPPIYQTQANILIKMEDSKSSPLGSGSMNMLKSFGFGGLSSSENIDDEVVILSSHSLMRKMIYELGLHKIYTLKKFPFDKSLYNNSPVVIDIQKEYIDTLTQVLVFDIHKKDNITKIKAKYGDVKLGEYSVDNYPAVIKTEVGSFNFDLNRQNDQTEKTKIKDSYKLEIAVLGLDYIAELYMKSVSIAPLSKKTNVIGLNVENENKERGKDILNTLIELYNKEGLEDKNTSAKNTVEFIRAQIAGIESELSSVEIELEQYKKLNNLTDIKAEAELVLETMGKMQEKTTELEIQLRLVEMIEDYIKKPENKYSLVPLTSGMSEGVANSIRDYNNIILERNRMLQNAKENNPAVISLNEQIDLLRGNIHQSIGNIRSEFAIAQQDWNRKETQIQSRISDMPRQERQYIDIRRRQEIQSELYIFLLQRLKESELTLASSTPKAKIVDAAYTISKPVSPKVLTTLIIGFLFGLVIPIIVIWLKGVFKLKLSDIAELEKNTDIPILGEICKDKSGKSIVVSETSTSPVTELFRLIRSNLQFVLTRKDEKVILVTSSISGEGKSFFVSNLAMSLALIKGKKVVMIGLDIRNPRLADYLSLNLKKGITTYLSSDEYTPDEVITNLPEYHPNLYIVPAGPIPPNPSELLLSDRLDQFFAYLRANFDYIVVDTAPVGMVSDTYALARISDATIYLYRADYTNKSYLKLANNIVKEEKLKKVSLVMNGTKTKSGYGYGYASKE